MCCTLGNGSEQVQQLMTIKKVGITSKPKKVEIRQIVPELSRDDAEPLVGKSYADAFEDTSLETVLSGLGVGRLVVTGAQTLLSEEFKYQIRMLD